MPRATVNGIELHYLDEGAGEAVVLIHGHTLDHRMWEPQARVLRSAGYRAIRPDLRGHGRSDATETGTEPEDLAADTKALLDRLGVDRAHIVGHSRGGGAALAFALDYPVATRTLTLVDAVLPGRPAGEETDAFMRRVFAGWRERGRAVFLDTWYAGDLFAGARRDAASAALLREMIAGYSAVEMTAWARGEGGPAPAQVADRLDALTLPTLVLVGDQDLPTFQRFADELASSIVGARRVVIAGAGHMATLEEPDAVNDALLAFLSEHR
jgi:pimeloyl-ACP methyl ester carboxylesterase